MSLPPEPDMDPLRRAHQPGPDPVAQLAQRRTGEGVERRLSPSPRSSPEAPAPAAGGGGSPVGDAREAPQDSTVTEAATGVNHVLHFRDRRPPHEVQFALEGELMTLFTAALDEGKLRLRARANVSGARYDFELRFVAASRLHNHYSLRAGVSWAEQPTSHHEYFRKASGSWFQLWTRDLTAANPPAGRDASGERYRRLCEAALQAQTQLDSVAAVQQAIVAGMKLGGTFALAHQEGGTSVAWRRGRFVRSDYGDHPELKEYTDETEFLRMLRQFCHVDVTRHAAMDPLPELDAWRLILRRMNPVAPPPTAR